MSARSGEEGMVRATEESAVPRISWATPLYEYLRRCNETASERRVLDCGAGGDDPHEDDEPDAYLTNFIVEPKQERYEDRIHGSGRLEQVYLEYIARKR